MMTGRRLTTVRAWSLVLIATLSGALYGQLTTATAPEGVRIGGRVYDEAVVRQLIVEKFDSSSLEEHYQGFVLVKRANRKLSGTGIGARIEALATKSTDPEYKRTAALCLVRIQDPASRPFVVSYLHSSDPWLSLFSVYYLAERMYQEDADEVMTVLMNLAELRTDLDKETATQIASNATMLLWTTSVKHKLPPPDPKNDWTRRRLPELLSWWQANRAALIQQLPPRPKPPATAPASSPASGPAN